MLPNAANDSFIGDAKIDKAQAKVDSDAIGECQTASWASGRTRHEVRWLVDLKWVTVGPAEQLAD